MDAVPARGVPKTRKSSRTCQLAIAERSPYGWKINLIRILNLRSRTHQSIAMPDFDSVAVALLVERTVTQLIRHLILFGRCVSTSSSRSNWTIETA